MFNTNLKCCLVATISLSFMSFDSLAAQTCGPGPHWIDDCPEGTDNVPFAAKVQIRIPCDSAAPTLILRGPIRAHRDAGVPGYPANPGDPGDPTHIITQEVLFLHLSGHGVTLRAGVDAGVGDNGDDEKRTWGIVTELADDPSLAQFSADYFYEVDFHVFGRTLTLHTRDACTVEGFLDQIPPPASLTMQPNEFPCSNMENIPLYFYDYEVGCLVTGGFD
jgi:hypothetical protein